jgi:hypothetical protein
MARQNPPLAQHLAEERLSDLSRGLGQRLYDDPSEGAEFVRDLLRSVASGLADREAVGEYAKKREIREHLHEAWRSLNDALAIMHPRQNPRRNPREHSAAYKAGAAAYRRLDRRAKGELGDQLVEGSFDWMDWFSDKPHPDFLRGFKDAWNPEEE